MPGWARFDQSDARSRTNARRKSGKRKARTRPLPRTRNHSVPKRRITANEQDRDPAQADGREVGDRSAGEEAQDQPEDDAADQHAGRYADRGGRHPEDHARPRAWPSPGLADAARHGRRGQASASDAARFGRRGQRATGRRVPVARADRRGRAFLRSGRIDRGRRPRGRRHGGGSREGEEPVVIAVPASGPAAVDDELSLVWLIRFAACARSGIWRGSSRRPGSETPVDPCRPDERVDDRRVELDAGELAELAEGLLRLSAASSGMAVLRSSPRTRRRRGGSGRASGSRRRSRRSG